MTAKDIELSLRALMINHNYVLANTYVFDWESDLFSITKTGTTYEIEIKISKADFKKDFGKIDKHFLLANHKVGIILKTQPEVQNDWIGHYWDPITGKSCKAPYCKVKWYDSNTFFIPNKFFYACPVGLIKKEQVPPYAGLIHFEDGYATIVKPAPFLHKRSLLDTPRLKQILLDKFHYKTREQYYQLKRAECRIEQLEQQLKQYE